MSNWNSGPYPQGDPNQGYYAGQPGYPPPQPGFPSAPPPGGYPSGPQGYPGGPQGDYPGGQPHGYPGGPPPPGAAYGFQPPPQQPPPYGDYNVQPGEASPFSFKSGAYGGTNYPDPEDPEVKGFDFSDQSVRRGFIRKVYSILMVQLSITLGFIALFVYHEPTKKYVQANPYLFIVAIVMIFVSMITLACCGEVRRKAPMNFIFLFLFTLAESFVLGVSASTYNKEEVVMAVGITTAVCLALTLFAFQTKWDFTMMGGILFVAVVVLMIMGFVSIFVHNKIYKLVYASIGALLFSIYLVYDTQMMMGGKHKYSISPEEYIFAAMNLYVDIINIFIYLLSIIGTSRD